MRLAEYRLDDLARISGVSARNIRAYRERGLLDPPRRQGRSAYYDDYHLAQLQTINRLLRRGFNSAHIAEFFESMREGHDLADILGIQRAVFGPPDASARSKTRSSAARPQALDLDPTGQEALKLLDIGLAERVDGYVVLISRSIGEIVARGTDQLRYVRMILRLDESTRNTIEEVAKQAVDAVADSVRSEFGTNYVPKPKEAAAFSQNLQDYRDLANAVVTDHLERALRQQMINAVSEYTTEIVFSGEWESRNR
jgi:DNA-binding transcriptional MerR regulator